MNLTSKWYLPRAKAIFNCKKLDGTDYSRLVDVSLVARNPQGDIKVSVFYVSNVVDHQLVDEVHVLNRGKVYENGKLLYTNASMRILSEPAQTIDPVNEWEAQALFGGY